MRNPSEITTASDRFIADIVTKNRSGNDWRFDYSEKSKTHYFTNVMQHTKFEKFLNSKVSKI